MHTSLTRTIAVCLSTAAVASLGLSTPVLADTLIVHRAPAPQVHAVNTTVYRAPVNVSRSRVVQQNPDGSATRSRSVSATGANGNVQRNGNVTRQADGSVAGSRSTSATGVNGATYQGNTAYASGTGLVHTGTCTNTAGVVVACR